MLIIFATANTFFHHINYCFRSSRFISFVTKIVIFCLYRRKFGNNYFVSWSVCSRSIKFIQLLVNYEFSYASVYKYLQNFIKCSVSEFVTYASKSYLKTHTSSNFNYLVFGPWKGLQSMKKVPWDLHFFEAGFFGGPVFSFWAVILNYWYESTSCTKKHQRNVTCNLRKFCRSNYWRKLIKYLFMPVALSTIYLVYKT